jgi:hypothetical protein
MPFSENNFNWLLLRFTEVSLISAKLFKKKLIDNYAIALLSELFELYPERF